MDGKKAGTAENEGHGGCSNAHLKPEFSHLYQMKFSVPCGCDHYTTCPLCKGTDKYSVGIYDYCDHLAYELDNAKERTKLLNKYRKQGFKFVVDFKGGFAGVNADDEQSARELILRKYPTYTITAITAL